VVDDEDRENEGDSLSPPKKSRRKSSIMATHGRGLIWRLPLTAERCDYLRSASDFAAKHVQFRNAFCESIDAREGVTTGISAADRTRTILTARSIPPPARPILPAPATYFRCAPGRVACWCAPGKPRLQWISLGWRGWSRPALSAKS
jgi:3,4-dihydroxy 2-butanone 4-phosphate synthase/GTP cyclohydrolase II